MMRSFQLSYFQLLYLLITALLECKAETQGHCKRIHQLNISYYQGDSMSISCLTTTHPLESLRVKLRSINQDKDVLMYPDISPASEHQRWSVRKDDGNVTLDLKDIRLSDDGFYDCQVYKDQDCLNATQFNLSIIKCKVLDSVHSTPGSSALLPCSEHPLQNRTKQVTWKVIIGLKPIDITQYHHPNKPSSSSEKPLYERVKQLKNGSLLIRDVVQADELWYRCSLNEKNCYEVKLVIKVQTLSTTVMSTASADSRFGQAESKNDENESVTTNSAVVVMTTVVSLCVLVSLTICVILYFRKQRRKTNSQKIKSPTSVAQLNRPFSVYYSPVADDFDVPIYSLVAQNTATMTTFCAKTSEAPALKPDDMYEKIQL